MPVTFIIEKSRPAASFVSCRRTHAWHGGFTLLELMISIGLGIVILLTCYAGLRVTAQSIIASKQIALENRLLRIGVERALEEVDFWNLMDDPLDPTRQQLRGTEIAPAASTGNGNGFMPFTPFSQTPDYVGDPVHGTTGFEDSTGLFDEPLSTGAHGGWSSSPLAWAAWNPRTWSRASPADKSTKGQSWGTNEIYDNLDKGQSWHYWYDDQVRGLVDALGFYGLYDYLPSNALIVYHGTSVPLGSPMMTATHGTIPTDGPIAWCSIPASLITDGVWLCPDSLYNAAEGQDNVMKGRVRNSNYSRTFLPSPQAEAASSSGLSRTSSPVGINGRYWQENGNNVISDQLSQVTTFMQQTLVGEELMPLRPATWCDVTYEAHRFMERGQPVTACIVTCRSSLTGSGFVISFTCLGTTLRGARQQRTPPSGAGWVVNPDIEPTLDYQSPP